MVAVALLTTMIQSGELGTADTTRRLQVTHSLWTNAPQVPMADYGEFGSAGRGGRIYAWYGIGQSLLMLPPDVEKFQHPFAPSDTQKVTRRCRQIAVKEGLIWWT